MAKSYFETRAGRFFQAVTAYPKAILFLGILLILSGAAFLPQMLKDTTVEAFIPADDPVRVYRDKAKDIFGLKDPMVIAVINKGPNGVFNPHSLALVSWLTERIAEVPGIDPDRITSLATENDIIGTEDGILVEPFFEAPPANQQEAERIRAAVMDFDLYLGSLVARDGRGTLIVAELLEEAEGHADEVYRHIREMVEQAPVNGEEIHVAGEGAVTGYLASYIDADARRLNPLAALIISIILFFAYRTLRGVLLPNFIVLATVAIALGGMAMAGVPFYVITNALPIILIAIAVADGIHIMGEYYEQVEAHPDVSQRELVIRTMVNMWRPVTITSLTTASGFLGIAFASYMPPMKAFGAFAAIGVMVAFLFAIIVIPAGLAILRPRSSKIFSTVSRQRTDQKGDRFGRMMAALGRAVIGRPALVLALGGMVVLAGIMGSLNLKVNEDRIENFQDSEPLVAADRAINGIFDGTTYFDIVIETPENEGLFQPENLQRIEAMQRYFETLPHVKGSTSIVDFLKQMNRAMNENRPEAYRIPGDADLTAQYFLLYSASSDPTDFDEYIDYDYRLANLRVILNSGRYTDTKVVKEAGERYIREHFNTPEITATLSGRASVDYQFISQIAQNHFRGVAIALLAVLLVAALSFRSLTAGVLSVVPVIISVLLIYAVMGLFGVWLGLGTSMFAAIAIGVGVDFAVHFIDRLILLVRDQKRNLQEAFMELFPSTGRALLFNFAAIFLGFGVLVTSSVPPLIRFGSLIGVSVAASFIGSMTILPALVYLIKPAFLGLKRAPQQTEATLESEPVFVKVAADRERHGIQ